MRIPLVSVALRSYNQKNYLRECIDTILAQDFDDYEIIVADDASTDGSQDLLREYQTKFPDKFKLILTQTNGGHTVNMNRALGACSGKYVAIFDGDDLMCTEKLRVQANYMDQHPECTVCYHNIAYFDNNSGAFLRVYNTEKPHYKGDVRLVIKYGSINCNVSSMLRREKIPINGCNIHVKIASDWLLYVDTLMNGGEIHYIDQVLANVRVHNQSVTKTRHFAAIFDIIKSSFIILKNYPKFWREVVYRWFGGAFNQLYMKFTKSNK